MQGIHEILQTGTRWEQVKMATGRKFTAILISAVVDTTFVDIYVDTKNIPTCRYNIQHIDKRTMGKMSIITHHWVQNVTFTN